MTDKEFWEACGLVFRCDKDGTVWTYDPDGNFMFFGYPDPNSIEFRGLLFKYAVPIAISVLMESVSERTAYEMLFYKWLQSEDKDLAQALKLAIEKVIE